MEMYKGCPKGHPGHKGIGKRNERTNVKKRWSHTVLHEHYC